MLCYLRISLVLSRSGRMVAWTAHSRSESSHIRPFQMHRDLDDLATLIEISFGQDLALTASRMVQDMRQFALLGPILRVAKVAMPLFAGYVWIEDGKLVGNASITEENRRTATWTLSNVAVLPAYRGRGIGGRLVDMAIDHIRRNGGAQILLQVRTDNELARTLYCHRGFASFDIWHEMDLPKYAWPTVHAPANRNLRPPRARD